MIERTNDEWLQALSTNDSQLEAALSDLRIILMNGLQRGLLGRVDTSAPEFDTMAEDFVQEALLKILAKKDTFAGHSKFTTWAHKITIHIALTELQRKRRQDNSLEQITEREDGEYTPSYTADPAPHPENQTARNAMLLHINELIENELTDKQRMVMKASIFEGKSTAVVAKQMDMKPNAVYKLLHDARMRLKKQLAEEGLSPTEVLAIFE